MPEENRKWVLAERPEGPVDQNTFRIETERQLGTPRYVFRKSLGKILPFIFHDGFGHSTALMHPPW